MVIFTNCELVTVPSKLSVKYKFENNIYICAWYQEWKKSALDNEVYILFQSCVAIKITSLVKRVSFLLGRLYINEMLLNSQDRPFLLQACMHVKAPCSS